MIWLGNIIDGIREYNSKCGTQKSSGHIFEGVIPLYLDDKAIQAIEDALRRGSDVQVQRQGQGCKVLEIKRTIKYTSA